MTALVAHPLLRRRSLYLTRKLLSTNDVSSGSQPLFLSLPETQYHEKPPRILFGGPPTSTTTTTSSTPPVPIIPVSSVTDIQAAVEHHYELASAGGQFVGGMGESDAGVWFVPAIGMQDGGGWCSDPLHHFHNLIAPGVEAVKQSRHGVPFGVYTSGTVHVEANKLKLFATIHVSLLASNPMDYCEAAGVFREELFGDVCNFLVHAEEEGLPIHVGVLKKFASDGRDLAMAMGAQQVDVYDS